MILKTVILSTLTVFSMSVAYANQDKTGCKIKRKTLEKQLEYAQADKDERLIAGLTRTLENIKNTCDLEKRLKEQNNKSGSAKNGLADSTPPLKQQRSKIPSRKQAKNRATNPDKANSGKKVQARQK
ncbi:DUF1090 family protein [Xenorhabdus nematophila]